MFFFLNPEWVLKLARVEVEGSEGEASFRSISQRIYVVWFSVNRLWYSVNGCGNRTRVMHLMQVTVMAFVLLIIRESLRNVLLFRMHFDYCTKNTSHHAHMAQHYSIDTRNTHRRIPTPKRVSQRHYRFTLYAHNHHILAHTSQTPT